MLMFFPAFLSSSGSVSSRTEQPTKFQMLLEKLRELSIRAKMYSVSRYTSVMIH